MKCEIALICATLLLNTFTLGQFSSTDCTKVKISFANSSNDLETTFTNLGVKFNKSAVYQLVLNDVYMQSGKHIFKDDDFKQFSSLRTLHLENGKIEGFPNSTFVSWKNDQYKNLDLINIGLRNISKDLLKPIFNLSRLNASHNELTLLADDIFDNSPNLSTVDLSYNKLNNWPRDIFQPIKCLFQLILSNNNISSLNDDIFSSQKANLVELDLNFNDIQHVPDKIFAGMDSLIVLKISHAFSPKYNTAHLPPNLFRNLPKLSTLEADHNNFHNLPEDIFSNLKNLKQLNLSSNNIESLSPKIFEKNHRLEELSLDNNKLRYLNK